MGLHFDILAVESDKIYARRGRIQRQVGIQPQWHNHPDAVRVPESVFSRLSAAFRSAHPEFNYYGPTEFTEMEIARLRDELTRWAGVGSATDSLTQTGTEDVVRRVLALAELAVSHGQSLLVLGI